MQIFIKGPNGKTFTLDCSPEDTVQSLFYLLDEKINGAPCHRLLFNGQQLDQNSTLKSYNIVKESTLTCVFSSEGHLYVKWQGKYLQTKDEPQRFHNFWGDLTCNNVFKKRYHGDKFYKCNTSENLTVYHLRKIVAKFLCLEPNDVLLSIPNDANLYLLNNTLLDSIKGAIIFVASVPEMPSIVVN